MKKTIVLILILVFCFPFAACIGAEQKGTPTAQPTAGALNTAGVTEQAETTEPAATVDPDCHYLTYAEVYNPETDFNNDLSHGNTTLLSTEDAYYYGSASTNYLYYYDKQSGDHAVLCSKPECMHDYTMENKSCNGYISARGSTLNLYDDRIWFFSTDNAGRYSLQSMALDGLGREKLFTVAEEDMYYAPMRGCIHRGRLYGCQWGQTVKNSEPVCYWNVTCWDIETGEFKVICEDENSDGWTEPWMYFFGKYVYICAAYTECEMDEENEVMIYGDSHIKAYRYDTETEQLETICDINEPGYAIGSYTICAAAEDRVYVAPVGGNTAVYQVTDGKLIKLFDAVSCARFSLFTDKAIAAKFENYHRGDISDVMMHIIVYDYESGVICEDTISFDELLSVYDNITCVGCGGVYAHDGAIIVEYGIELGDDAAMDCLVKYELVDGKLEDTIIAAAKCD